MEAVAAVRIEANHIEMRAGRTEPVEWFSIFILFISIHSYSRTHTSQTLFDCIIAILFLHHHCQVILLRSVLHDDGFDLLFIQLLFVIRFEANEDPISATEKRRIDLERIANVPLDRVNQRSNEPRFQDLPLQTVRKSFALIIQFNFQRRIDFVE